MIRRLLRWLSSATSAFAHGMRALIEGDGRASYDHEKETPPPSWGTGNGQGGLAYARSPAQRAKHHRRTRGGR